ncbi:MAG: helix-turn-helix domain-containing protein [Fervidicoccaceae archaeon]
MLTRSFCELYLKNCATAIRVAVAKELINKYGYSQTEAAKLVGISQPLLNYVLKGKRRIRGLSEIEKSNEASEIIRRVADAINLGKVVDMCDVCMTFRKKCAPIMVGEKTL